MLGIYKHMILAHFSGSEVIIGTPSGIKGIVEYIGAVSASTIFPDIFESGRAYVSRESSFKFLGRRFAFSLDFASSRFASS